MFSLVVLSGGNVLLSERSRGCLCGCCGRRMRRDGSYMLFDKRGKEGRSFQMRSSYLTAFVLKRRLLSYFPQVLLIELFLRGYEQALGARLNSMVVLNAFPP